MRYFFILMIYFLTGNVYAQEDLEIFAWKSFLPYKYGKWVTQSDNNIIYAADQSLLFLSKEDLSATFMSKVDGLTDTGVEKVFFDSYQNQIIVIYENSNIDLVSDDGVYNVPDIKNNTSIIGSKKINDVHVASANRILFATDFGIIEYRSDRLEFGTTIFTNLVVNEISSVGNEVYAATDDGLYYFIDSDNNNFADFGQWSLLGQEVGLPALYEAKTISAYNGQIYFSDGRSIYTRTAEGFVKLYQEADNRFNITYLSEGNRYLMAGLRAPSESRIIYLENGSFVEGDASCVDRIRYSIEDDNGQIWYADNFRPFRYSERIDGGCRRLEFNSPLSIDNSDVAVNDKIVVVASGGVSDNYQDLFDRDGIYLLSDGEWNNINESNYAPIRENEMLNFHKVEISPDGKKVIFASFWNGLLEYDLDSGESTFFGKENSALQFAFADTRVRISDVKYDGEDNLWMTNYLAENPLVVRTTEGEWYSYSLSSDNRVGDIAIDDFGNIWIVIVGNNGGVYVYNPGTDLSSTHDDQHRKINSSNSEISSSTIYTVEKDLNGDIWVGTAEGAILFDCGTGVFENDCQGSRPQVEVDSILDFLLVTEEVVSIAIDGGNRKWFGTRNGIFVQSPQGENQITRFTVDNSPLFADQIVDLTYDGTSGLMYIATDKGLQAIRTATTLGRNIHSSQVYAFPNPVPPDYNGPIAIKGLAQDAKVKITDITGRIVYESIALGGQAIWYGEDLDGNRAKTGVYLVFSVGESSFGNPDSYVSKILLVND